jgi:outer membrane protein assembly factor BamD
MPSRMVGILLKNRRFLVAILGLSLAGSVGSTSGQQKNAKKSKTGHAADLNASAEPDKVLYDRAMSDIKHGRYTEGRLSLQTLINTYPDSEYLAKAKLGVADSYYKEGGTSSMTQAVQEYKDFITFFPFLDEAAYAQMQVGMAHYRMMEKTDRDKTHANAAEDEFQTFLLKYPQSPLLPKAEQELRDVQEVLADGQYKVARFYYLKQDYRASGARLVELTERYPLYSQSDGALWMLGDVYSRAKQASKNEDEKNHWADLAAQCYTRIVHDYPLSRLAGDAKSRLTAMGMPVPAEDPSALARLQKEQLYAREHPEHALLKLPMRLVKSSPDVSAAAHSGEPNLNPPDDAISATEILKPGAAGPSFNVAARPLAARDGSGGDPTAVVAVPSESSGSLPTTDAAVTIIDAPTATSVGPPASSAADPPENPPTATASSSIATSASSSETAAQNGATVTPQSISGTTGAAGGQPEKSKSDPKTESTSKKKKGVHKLIPW